MPPNNKKKGRANNNKKKGRAPRTTRPSSTAAAAAAAAGGGGGGGGRRGQDQENASNSTVALSNIVNSLPTFHRVSSALLLTQGDDSGTTGGGIGSSISSSTGGYYEIYKRATTSFWEWMKQTLPTARMQSVNDLRQGVDVILEHNMQTLNNNNTNKDEQTETDHQQHQQNDKNNNDPIVAPQDVMEQLSVSILYREVMADTKFGGQGTPSGGGSSSSDIGHRYMIETLKYCRNVLEFSRLVARVALKDSAAAKEEEEEEEKQDQVRTAASEVGLFAIGGRLQALLLEEDDDDDEEEEENDIRQGNFKTFEAPEPPAEEIDIQETLINGDDFFQAIALLNTMDDLMGAIDSHYGFLKNCMRGQQEGHFNSILQLLMECTVAANFATETIRAAESSLVANHPHLSSFYHVLALVIMPTFVAQIEQEIQDKTKLEREPHMALNHVASVIECSFHSRGDQKVPEKIKRFAKKSGIPMEIVERESKQIHLWASYEMMLFSEEQVEQNADLARTFQGGGLGTTHVWLERYPHIGGDRCILNTQNIVQKTLAQVKNRSKLVGRLGFWGPEFDEQTNPATRIRGDLDSLLGGSILPELIALCIEAPFHRLPDTSQLLTVLDLMHQYCEGDDKTRPVPIALTFGLHAILTSIFALQGSGDLARLATYAKQSYNTLFDQLEGVSDPSHPPENAPNFYWNVAMFKNLKAFAKPVVSAIPQGLPPFTIIDTALAEQRAFWNPLTGGEYMLYGTYICSIGLGSATVDSLGQLRFCLHLYNALKQHCTPFQVPFLDNLDNIFNKTTAVWVGGRPEKGSYAKHFWLAWGMSVSRAAQLGVSDNEQGDEKFLASRMKGRNGRVVDEIRKLDEYYPEEYSASYRRLVKQDFTDEEGTAEFTCRDASKEQKKQKEGLIDLLTRVNITRDAMDDDGDLMILQVNFSAIGCILLEFVNALSHHMGWDVIVNQVIRQFPEPLRRGQTMGGGRMRPGGFNASDLNLRHQGLAHLWGNILSRLDNSPPGDTIGMRDASIDKASAFTTQFFGNIPKERYTFFVEKDEHLGPDTSSTGRRRSPLEGSYPHGRTGKTIQDPLQAFWVSYYNKRGKPASRLIKPGKYTPFRHDADFCAESPYGPPPRVKKLTRSGPNGKYRHIASYSLDELIALGWDGAMYNSHNVVPGQYVPYIPGYDSDSEDEYEPIDDHLPRARRDGVVGLPQDEKGLYMKIPYVEPGGQLVQLSRT